MAAITSNSTGRTNQEEVGPSSADNTIHDKHKPMYWRTSFGDLTLSIAEVETLEQHLNESAAEIDPDGDFVGGVFRDPTNHTFGGGVPRASIRLKAIEHVHFFLGGPFWLYERYGMLRGRVAGLNKPASAVCGDYRCVEPHALVAAVQPAAERTLFVWKLVELCLARFVGSCLACL